MKYNICLPIEKLVAMDVVFDYDKELDDISSLTSDIANSFNDQKIQFDLSLNNKRLISDIWGDFPYFLDGFKDYIFFVFSPIKIFNFEFLNQGIETTVNFVKSEGGFIKVVENQITNEDYLIHLEDLKREAVFFWGRFTTLIEFLLPNLLSTTLYLDWKLEIDRAILIDKPGRKA